MKVFVVAFLIIGVSCIEAAVVKREAPNENPVPGLEQVSVVLSKFKDLLATGTQELMNKIQAQELQTNAQSYFDKAKEQVEPIQAELNKFLESLIEMAKSMGQ